MAPFSNHLWFQWQEGKHQNFLHKICFFTPRGTQHTYISKYIVWSYRSLVLFSTVSTFDLTYVVPFCCATHRSQAIYTAVSGWSIYRYGVISFFQTPLDLTIYFRAISSELINMHMDYVVNGHCSFCMLIGL